ncbi:MAG: hypothetical protein ABS882_11440 [Lysinibacillus sp.]
MTDIKNTILLLQQLAEEDRATNELLPVAQQIVQDLSQEEGQSYIEDAG